MGKLCQINAHCREEAGDAVSELMERILGESATIAVDEDTRRTVVTVYFSQKRTLDDELIADLKTGFRLIKDCGLGQCRLKVKDIKDEDWAESWKRHFKPMTIGGRLLVRPSWSRRKPTARQVSIVLDPGLAFGTGQHPTTGFCLEQVVEFQKAGKRPTFMDMGTGSGILALAAAKLGYAKVEAFDYDEVCVKVSEENAVRNRVQSKVHFFRKDLTKMSLRPRVRFDLVCANILYDVLIDQRDRILNRVAPNGRLVLAGILRRQFGQVRSEFEAGGMKLIAQKREKEWQSGAFEWGG